MILSRFSGFLLFVAMTGLPAMAGQAVSAEFTYNQSATATENYHSMTVTAERVCQAQAQRSDTFVERVGREHRQSCEQALLDAAISQFANAELTRLHTSGGIIQLAEISETSDN